MSSIFTLVVSLRITQSHSLVTIPTIVNCSPKSFPGGWLVEMSFKGFSSARCACVGIRNSLAIMVTVLHSSDYVTYCCLRPGERPLSITAFSKPRICIIYRQRCYSPTTCAAARQDAKFVRSDVPIEMK